MKIYKENFDISSESPSSGVRTFARNVEILLIYFLAVVYLYPTNESLFISFGTLKSPVHPVVAQKRLFRWPQSDKT